MSKLFFYQQKLSRSKRKLSAEELFHQQKPSTGCLVKKKLNFDYITIHYQIKKQLSDNVLAFIFTSNSQV